MRTMRYLMALSVVSLAACGEPVDNPEVDESELPAAEVCSTIVAEKMEAHGAELADFPITDVPSMHETSEVGPGHTAYAGRYRELATHPGCMPRDAYTGALFLNFENEAEVAPGVPVQSTDTDAPGYLPGYDCAAKAYAMPAGVDVDPDKPIVILMHGNSSSPNSWEEYAFSGLEDQNSELAGVQRNTISEFQFTVDAETREMLAAKLVAQGYQVYALDLRTDLVPYLEGANLQAGPADPGFGDAAGNVDHGWSVPIAESLVSAVMAANPGKKVSIVGHSLGVTVIMDALRRLHLQHQDDASAPNPFAQLQDVILASGAVHGVAGGDVNCATYATMRGSVNCEMGDRGAYVQTEFGKRINGPADLYSTPCADGDFAYGEFGQCDGNVVQYTTLTMRDPEGGALQDEFVSESAARINMDRVKELSDGTRHTVNSACVDNHLLELSDYDSSGFFITGLQGFLASHFGSIRSEAGMSYIMDRLAD